MWELIHDLLDELREAYKYAETDKFEKMNAHELRQYIYDKIIDNNINCMDL